MIPLDVKQIRRLNLKLLIDEVGTQAEVANRSDTDASYISQILRKKKPRDIGDRVARKFEAGCAKQHGWMDRAHIDEWKKHGIATDSDLANYEPSARSNDQAIRERAQYNMRRKIHVLPDWKSIIDWLDEESIPKHSPTIDKPAGCGDRTYALTVRSDIMAPIFPERAYIIVDPDRPPRHGTLVVVHIKGWNEATFRKLVIDANQMYLEPLNKAYEPIKLSDYDYRYCGRVVKMVMEFDDS
jgi:SOS-response transcriptional repressor LexA